MEEVVRPIFDWTDVREYFPSVRSPNEEREDLLAQFITRRLEEITPSAAEQAVVQGFFTKVTTVIENLIASGEGAELMLDEVRAVGSQKKGVSLIGGKTADAVIIFKKAPTDVMVTNLGIRVAEILNSPEANTIQQSSVNHQSISKLSFLLATSDGVSVIVYATTTAPILAQLPSNSEDGTQCAAFLRMVRHARWFEEHIQRHTSVRQLIRLIKDLKCREEAFQSLNPWYIELLCHCASVPLDGGDILPLPKAYIRLFQLLSAGLFLPGSIGIPDPCEEEEEGIHNMMTSVEMDQLTAISQMILRLLQHGAYQSVLSEGGVRPADFTKTNMIGKMKVLPPNMIATDDD